MPYVAKGEKRQVRILCMLLSTVAFLAWLAFASPGLTRITLPASEVPVGQRPVNAAAAELAVTLQQLRKRLRRARWIPWQRRKRPQMQAQIDELVRTRRALRADGVERGQRL